MEFLAIAFLVVLLIAFCPGEKHGLSLSACPECGMRHTPGQNSLCQK